MAKPKKQKKIAVTIAAATLLIAIVFLAWPTKANIQRPSASDQASPGGLSGGSPSQTSFNKSLYPVNQASSLWAVVNKGRALPSDYVPQNLAVPEVPLRLSSASQEMHLRADAAMALGQMFAAAKSSGISLKLESGYRSYSEQASVYQGYVSHDGTAKADTYSARPGHSEHQTGLAADIEPYSRLCEVDQCFESTPEGKWLAANSYKFGFVIRYQKNTQDITGYEYEPWHVRYVGAPLAAQLYSSKQTLEQFFNLPFYTSYPAQSYELKDI